MQNGKFERYDKVVFAEGSSTKEGYVVGYYTSSPTSQTIIVERFDEKGWDKKHQGELSIVKLINEYKPMTGKPTYWSVAEHALTLLEVKIEDIKKSRDLIQYDHVLYEHEECIVATTDNTNEDGFTICIELPDELSEIGEELDDIEDFEMIDNSGYAPSLSEKYLWVKRSDVTLIEDVPKKKKVRISSLPDKIKSEIPTSFEAIKVGDYFKLNNKRGGSWNGDGLMDVYKAAVVKVASKSTNTFKIHNLKNETHHYKSNHWTFRYNDIERYATRDEIEDYDGLNEIFGEYKVGDWVIITKSKSNWIGAMDAHDGRIVQITEVKELSQERIIIKFAGSGYFSWESKDGHFKKVPAPIVGSKSILDIKEEGKILLEERSVDDIIFGVK